MQIYVLGDSISMHYGPYLQAYLSGVMAYARKEGAEEALLNLDNPQGANGGDSGMVLSFLKSKAERGGVDADLLLLNCGLHDIKTNPHTGAKQVSRWVTQPSQFGRTSEHRHASQPYPHNTTENLFHQSCRAANDAASRSGT